MMNHDPFSNDDKTVLRPTPGGRRLNQSINVELSSTTTPLQKPSNYESINTFNSNQVLAYGDNLIDMTANILSLAVRLKSCVSYSAFDELKPKLAKQISEFENKAVVAKMPQEQVRIASYALCAFLDETIQNTPFGAQSNWGQQSLLILFHKEAWGGERFFQMMDQVIRYPAQNLNLLEFFYVLLSFGFEGKYRVMGTGLNQLERHRIEIYQLIQRVKGDNPNELSVRWQGLNIAKNTLSSQIPLWILGSIVSSLLLICYIGFYWLLNATSDPVYRELVQLAKEPVQLAVASQPPAKIIKGRLDRFKPLLREEISNNMVEVVDDSILRVRNSFNSGSDQVKPEFVAMLHKIAKELENDQDSILVTGHTDDKPIVSAKFPSNWHLSAARANNVLSILSTTAQLKGTARSEGRADSEPLMPNDTPEHRAMNRRVDILVK